MNDFNMRWDCASLIDDFTDLTMIIGVGEYERRNAGELGQWR
jgi:hypothetical protein